VLLVLLEEDENLYFSQNSAINSTAQITGVNNV